MSPTGCNLSTKGLWEVILSLCPCAVPSPLSATKRNKFAEMYRQLLGLRQLSRRTVTSSANRQMENSVKEKQKLFQEDNGLPIHLKGGTGNALLYRATMALTVFGAAYVVYELFSAAMPKKPH